MPLYYLWLFFWTLLWSYVGTPSFCEADSLALLLQGPLVLPTTLLDIKGHTLLCYSIRYLQVLNSKNPINEYDIRIPMSRRRLEQDKSKKVAISVTLDKELYDFIEHGIRMRWWLNRSQAINMMGFAFIRSQQSMQPTQSQVSQSPPNFGRLPP